jgi:hypothetical protein
LLQPLQCLRLQRWLVLFRWLQWLPHWLQRQPLSLLWLLWSLWPQLPGLRLVLSPLPSVVLAMLACPRPVPLWPVRLALRWLLPLPCLRLQQQLSLKRPSQPLCRLSSLRWLSPLQLQMLRPLLLLLPH